MTDKEIIKEILEWIELNDCRSYTLVKLKNSNVLEHKHWKKVFYNKTYDKFFKEYIASWNRNQKSKGIKAPQGMSLFNIRLY